MKEKLKQQYDSLYGSEGKLYGNDKAIKLIRNLQKYMPAGKVLDIGGGEGRNALFLAKQGYEVSVIDISEVGISKLQTSAKQTGVEIKTKVADVTDVGITDSYDAIIMSFVLHHINTEETVKLIRDAQSRTNQGGVHIIATFINQGALFERNEFKSRFYPSPKDLEDIYDGWEILLSSLGESTSRAKDKKGERLKNGVIRFIARKV